MPGSMPSAHAAGGPLNGRKTNRRVEDVAKTWSRLQALGELREGLPGSVGNSSIGLSQLEASTVARA